MPPNYILPLVLKAAAALLLFSSVNSDRVTHGPKTLEEDIQTEFVFGRYDGLNRFSSLLTPAGPRYAQTPISVRWGLLVAILMSDVRSGCHANALSFFGTNDKFPERFCKETLSKLLILSYSFNYIYRRQFPIDGDRFTRYLMSLGLTPLSKSADMNTLIGIGNILGARTHNFSKNDGWNVYGHPSDLPYADRTGYKPINPPGVPENKLRYPLRWQPLTQTDLYGNFFVQKHVTPHIGLTAKPILMPLDELTKRRTKGPYRHPNRRTMHPVDRKIIFREAKKTFALSNRLTRQKIQEAFFWDNKPRSSGFISFYYCGQFYAQGFLSSADEAFDCVLHFALHEAIATYDATILAWHEKRRHDIARPQTLIRQIFQKGKWVHAYRGIGRGFGIVDARKWEPLIPAQPHSEYPSGSAMICSAVFESQELGIRSFLRLGKNESIPPLVLRGPSTIVARSPFLDNVNFTFNSPRQMAKRCGQSRLWAGVHFSASVRDGSRVVKGIGKMAYDFVNDLENGKVPKNCRHCLTQ